MLNPDTLINLEKNVAMELILKDGLFYRCVREDELSYEDRLQYTTPNYQVKSRINIEVENGIVVKAYIG